MSDTVLCDTISRNLKDVQARIGAACERSGRKPADVRLIAVTKYAEWEWVQALSEFHTVFGENRPQQLAERHPLLPQAEWHLIGQLQRNKVRPALQHAAMIHSVDSLKLLSRIASVATELQENPEILLQVNVSGEASKSGFDPQELTDNWSHILRDCGPAVIRGFMTMAPIAVEPQDTRKTFRQLAELRRKLAEHPDSVAQGLPLSELSMGMSGDYEVAIEEGATMIRVGSRLYQGL